MMGSIDEAYSCEYRSQCYLIFAVLLDDGRQDIQPFGI